MSRWFNDLNSEEVHLSNRNPDVSLFPEDAPAGAYARIQRRRWKVWVNYKDGIIWHRKNLRENDWEKLVVAGGAGHIVRYGAGAPTIIAGDTVGAVYHQTSDGLSTGVLMNTWTFDGTSWFNESQPINVTRAQILALRTAGQLRQSQHYLITDLVQGRLVAGTTVLVHATSNTEISENVTVNTTYDNEGWRGIFDVDRAIVLELTDNRGNTVKGINGIEVANFDWGNSAYSGNTVESATLNVTYGNGVSIANNNFKQGSVTTLTSFAGNITNTNIEQNAAVLLTSSNLSISGSIIRALYSISATSYTGGGSVSNCNLSGAGILNLAGSTSSITFSGNTSVGTSTINHNTVSSGVINFQNNEFAGCNITHSNGAPAFTITNCRVDRSAIVTNTLGTITLSGSTISSSAVSSTIAGGTINISLSKVDTNSAVSNSSANSISINNSTISDVSSVTAQNGSLGGVSVTNSRISGNVTVTTQATSTAGSLSVQQGTNLTSFASVQKAGTGNLFLSQCSLSSSTALSHAAASTRNYTLIGVNSSSLGQINLSGTGVGITDFIQYCNIAANGQIALSATGASQNFVQYCTANGLSGFISLIGTTSGKTLQRAMADNGVVQINNDVPTNSYTFLHASNGGSVIIQGITVARVIQYLEASNAGAIVINAPTISGNFERCHADSSSSIFLNTNAGSAQYVHAYANGVVNINGGTGHSGIVKSMSSTLTTGNFAQVNIYHHSNVSQTLTAANTFQGRDRFNNSLV